MLVLLLATWPRRILIALLLLVPVLVAAGGGFTKADPPPRTVEVGAATDAGGFLVVPQHYFVSETVDAGSLEPGERWVGAVVEITNQGTEPIGLGLDQTFELPASIPTDGSENPHEVMRIDLGGYLGRAQPGVTYEAALLWRTTDFEEPPAELTLTMNRTAWTKWVLEAGLYTWRSTEQSYEVVLPLGDAPESILEEEEE